MLKQNMVNAVSRIAAGYLAGNKMPLDRVPVVIEAIAEALQTATQRPVYETAKDVPSVPQKPTKPLVPAVPVESSVRDEYLISLIDGRQYKVLTRHLRVHGLSADQYREAFGLPSDYPMVAPAYSMRRKTFAHEIGLGKRGKASRWDRESA